MVVVCRWLHKISNADGDIFNAKCILDAWDICRAATTLSACAFWHATRHEWAVLMGCAELKFLLNWHGTALLKRARLKAW